MKNTFFLTLIIFVTLILIGPSLFPVKSQGSEQITIQSTGEEKAASESEAATAESPTSHLLIAGVGIIAIAVAIIALKNKLFHK